MNWPSKVKKKNKKKTLQLLFYPSKPPLVESAALRSSPRLGSQRGWAVEYPSTTFHHSCLAVLKFDAEDLQSGGRAAREQTLDVSQRSWMPAQRSEAQKPAGLLEQPSCQVPTAWRTPSRRDEGGKFCPAWEAGNNKMSHGAAPESANQQVMEKRELFHSAQSGIVNYLLQVPTGGSRNFFFFLSYQAL